MVFFNYALRKLNAKIVYYGPGLCGKTTNLQWIHDHFEGGDRGELLSLATEGDRTIFFDLLPLDIGTIRGMEVTLQLYTVPGQVHYNSTRQLVLRGADGVVFVADSQRAMLQSNIDSWRNLKENLELQGIELASFPHVLQFNKRDLKDICSVEELDQALNEYSAPIFEAVAIEGIGVQETLEGIVKLVMRSLRQRYESEFGAPAVRPATTSWAPPRPLAGGVSVAPPAEPAPGPGPAAEPPPAASEPAGAVTRPEQEPEPAEAVTHPELHREVPAAAAADAAPDREPTLVLEPERFGMPEPPLEAAAETGPLGEPPDGEESREPAAGEEPAAAAPGAGQADAREGAAGGSPAGPEPREAVAKPPAPVSPATGGEEEAATGPPSEPQVVEPAAAAASSTEGVEPVTGGTPEVPEEMASEPFAGVVPEDEAPSPEAELPADGGGTPPWFVEATAAEAPAVSGAGEPGRDEAGTIAAGEAAAGEQATAAHGELQSPVFGAPDGDVTFDEVAGVGGGDEAGQEAVREAQGEPGPAPAAVPSGEGEPFEAPPVGGGEAFTAWDGDPFAEPAGEPLALAPVEARAVEVSQQGNQLSVRLEGTGALAEYGQVRELDLVVPVPGGWIGGRRVTLQLRLTLVPEPEDG